MLNSTYKFSLSALLVLSNSLSPFNLQHFFFQISGGFGSYLLALNKKTYEQTGVSTEGNPPGSYKEPAIGWMTSYLVAVCFIGLFVLIPLRKVHVLFCAFP